MAPTTRAAFPTVVGMSCIFRSRKILYPYLLMAMTASGPLAAKSSRPILATPNHGCSSRANRVASTRSSTSRARASRSRVSMCGSDDLWERKNGVPAAPGLELIDDARGGAGICEGGGADLNGGSAGHEELDDVGASGDAADADDGCVGEGGMAIEHSSNGDGMDGGTAEPSASGTRTQTRLSCLGIDRHSHHRVGQGQAVGAGLERAARDVGDVGDVRAELHPERLASAEAGFDGRHDFTGGFAGMGEHATAVLNV